MTKSRAPFDAAQRSRLADYLRALLGGSWACFDIEPISGGQSNPTFFVSGEGRRLVLRKKPSHAVLPSAHAVDREFRIMRALARTAVPVPPTLAYCPEESVVGAPFYLMERVDGRVFHDSALSELEPKERRACYLASAVTLARLHAVDWAGLGLSDFGKPGNYFERQLARWRRQFELSQGAADSPTLRLFAALDGRAPDDDQTTIVHGDYRVGNLMFRPDTPEVAAVLDWELSTLGHPLADLAHFAMFWRCTPEEYGGLRGLDLDALGIPSEEEWMGAYSRAAGRPVCLSPFHVAFAFFRFAAIFEGIAARARAGAAASENAAEVGRLSTALAHRGLEALGVRAQSAAGP